MIQFIIMIGFCLILPDLIFGKSNMKSTIIMLIILYSYSFIFHKIYLNKFNEAINLYKKKNINESLIKFDEAYKFFNKHYIIDKFRFVIFLNSNKKSYRELSLLYIAKIYSEIDNIENSILTYNKVLELNSKCFEAKIALEDFDIRNNNDYNYSMNDIQIPLNKKKILLFNLLISLFIFPTPFILTDNNINLLSKFIIILASIFFMVGFIFLITKLFDPRPGLLVNNKGFLDNTSLSSFRFIEWDYVKSIKFTNEGKYNFVRICLSNSADILKKQSYHVRLIAKMNKKRFNGGINISAALLNCSLIELKHVLQNGRRR